MKLKTVTADLVNRVKDAFFKKHRGVDGILVTIGLCIIALLLCVAMKESISTFVSTIVGEITTAAKNLLSGVS